MVQTISDLSNAARTDGRSGHKMLTEKKSSYVNDFSYKLIKCKTLLFYLINNFLLKIQIFVFLLSSFVHLLGKGVEDFFS